MIGISIVSVIILLGVLIFFHELGHFLAARIGGVGVTKFSLGFGPKIIGKKIGMTEYILSLIPLGGYVKLVGEIDTKNLSPEEEKMSFAKQPVWKRIFIVFCWSFIQFSVGDNYFFCCLSLRCPCTCQHCWRNFKKILPLMKRVSLKDKIVSIDGKNSLWDDIRPIVTESEGRILEIIVQRAEETKKLLIKPKLSKTQNIFGEKVNAYLIGVSLPENFIIDKKYMGSFACRFRKDLAIR